MATVHVEGGGEGGGRGGGVPWAVVAAREARAVAPPRWLVVALATRLRCRAARARWRTMAERREYVRSMCYAARAVARAAIEAAARAVVAARRGHRGDAIA